VKVELGVRVSPDDVVKENADAVFVATGARPVVPEIPGVDKGSVITAVDLLDGKAEPGDRAVILGGGLVGCEIAIWLAQKGKSVTIIEMLPTLMSGGVPVPSQVRMMVQDMLGAHHVDVVTDAEVTEITSQGVRALRGNAQPVEVMATTIVLAVGMTAERRLYEDLSQRLNCVYAIGDCREPKNIMNAVWDAYEIARAI